MDWLPSRMACPSTNTYACLGVTLTLSFPSCAKPLLVQDGVVRPEIAAKYVANSPLAFVDQYVPELKQYRAIAMDVGDMDNLMATNKQMDEALTRLGVSHTFEIYEGTHGNRVKERFETKVLPFFSASLKAQAGGAGK